MAQQAQQAPAPPARGLAGPSTAAQQAAPKRQQQAAPQRTGSGLARSTSGQASLFDFGELLCGEMCGKWQHPTAAAAAIGPAQCVQQAGCRSRCISSKIALELCAAYVFINLPPTEPHSTDLSCLSATTIPRPAGFTVQARAAAASAGGPEDMDMS